jgi:2-dehydro-3-deoxygalactonokinase
VADGAYIAVDWGTTNRRAYLIGSDGTVHDEMADGAGVLSLTPEDYPSEIDRLRRRFGVDRVLAAGMVGSNRGWIVAPYVDAPADLDALAAAAVTPAAGVRLVPGIAVRRGGRADVMRGEEEQAFGAIAAGTVGDEALLCQPGTHCKWIRMEGSRIADVSTALTGELFALLRTHGTLAGMLDGTVADGATFRDGVARGAGATDLLDALFEVRASVLLDQRDPAEAAAYASGVLIGADVGARDLGERPVALLASGTLATLYAAAIAALGGTSVAVDSKAAFVAGVHAVHGRLE